MKTDICIHKGCRGTVTGSSVEVEEFAATQEVSCDWCGASWTLVFDLSERILVYEGTGPRKECLNCGGLGLSPDLRDAVDCGPCGGLGHVADGMEY